MSSETLDLGARYRIAGHGAIAFYLEGYALQWTSEEWIYDGEGDPDEESSYLYCEPEQVEDRSMVRAVMVGDDHVWTVDVDDLEPLKGSDYCHECGQIGCQWGTREDEDV